MKASFFHIPLRSRISILRKVGEEAVAVMWEDGTSKETSQNAPPTAKPPIPKSGEDYALWAQIILCTLVFAAVLCARKLGLPIYAELRIAYSFALSQPGPEIPGWDGEREFVKFTQETFAALRSGIKQCVGDFSSTPETARRTVHNRPSGGPVSSEESYLPSFPLHFPLPERTQLLTSGYGLRTDPVGGLEQGFHTGVDLPAQEGTPVLAAADGVVRFAKEHASYGNYIRLLHEGGDETIYAHMQYLFVRSGQRVSAGQVLGTSGQTGNVTGPHLHFELLHEGVRYDPAEALENAN